MQATELGKHCYVAPANPAGRQLLAQLKAAGVSVLGLVDNLKVAEDIANLSIPLADDTIVIVALGNAQADIAAGLLKKGVNAAAVYLQCGDKLQVKPYRAVGAGWLRCYKKMQQLAIRLLCAFIPKRYVVYYAEHFVDTNLLLQFREHQRKVPGEAMLLCRNMLRQPALHSTLSQPVLQSVLAIYWYLSRAKLIVIDHEYNSADFTLFRRYCQTIQLWHGLPYKYISGNRHLLTTPDSSFISSSDWYNQHVFNTLFSAQHYLALGYARNDAFLQSTEQMDWCNAVLQADMQQVMANTGELWIYMPTYRDDQSALQLDLSQLNTLCRQWRKSLVLKLHPFISRQLASQFIVAENDEQLLQLPEYPHIYLYPSGMNIYPWLAHSEALITDYSSVATDYLLHDGVLIYYQYDGQDYAGVRGRFLVDDSYFLAGPVATNFDNLCQLLQQYVAEGDRWHVQRQKLRQRLLLTEQLATPAILQHIRQLAQNAD